MERAVKAWQKKKKHPQTGVLTKKQARSSLPEQEGSVALPDAHTGGGGSARVLRGCRRWRIIGGVSVLSDGGLFGVEEGWTADAHLSKAG